MTTDTREEQWSIPVETENGTAYWSPGQPWPFDATEAPPPGVHRQGEPKGSQGPRRPEPEPTRATGASASQTITGPSAPRIRQPTNAYAWPETEGNYMRISKDLPEDVGPHEVLVFVALSKRETGTFVSWPTWRELEEDTGLTEPQVRYALGKLVRAGYLSIEPWADKRGNRDASCYVLFPRCKSYTTEELRALRGGGNPDTRRAAQRPPQFADLVANG